MGWSEQDEADFQLARKQIESEVAEKTKSLEQEIAKLREELAAATGWKDEAMMYCKNADYWRRRAEAAEAKLKALDEQEPVCTVSNVLRGGLDLELGYCKKDAIKCGTKLYAKPIPPAAAPTPKVKP